MWHGRMGPYVGPMSWTWCSYCYSCQLGLKASLVLVRIPQAKDVYDYKRLGVTVGR